jgi:hypothetical protein
MLAMIHTLNLVFLIHKFLDYASLNNFLAAFDCSIESGVPKVNRVEADPFNRNNVTLSTEIIELVGFPFHPHGFTAAHCVLLGFAGSLSSDKT